MSQLLWHYMLGVPSDGLAAATEVFASRKIAARELPFWFDACGRAFVDFTSNPNYRCNSHRIEHDGGRYTLAELAAKFGVYRIGVAIGVAPHTFYDLTRITAMSKVSIDKALAGAAQTRVRLLECRVSFDDVPAVKWERVERFNGSAWESFAWEGVTA